MEAAVNYLPLLTCSASPRDTAWPDRLRQEYECLISYITKSQEEDNVWFNVEPDDTGLVWRGRCWHIHELIRYEFDMLVELPATYPASPPDIRLPELDGKTAKMYRGGKICMDIHFAPLWARKQPGFGVAHSLALALGPWLAAEIPDLVGKGLIGGS